MKPQRLKLTPRIALAFVAFAALLLAAVGVGIYQTGQDALQRAALSELQAVAADDEAALTAWNHNNQTKLAILSLAPELSSLLTAPDENAQAQAQLVLRRWVEGGAFREVLLLDAVSGKVLADTEPGEVGKFNENEPFFINGRYGPYVQPPFYSLKLQAATMMVSAPILSSDTRLLGVLAGRVDLRDLSDIINRRSDVYQSDETYLVDHANLFVTQPRFVADPAVLQRGAFSQVVGRCLAGQSGSATEADYRGVLVLSVYRWLPAQELCLVNQIDQAEAVAPEQAFGMTLLAVSLLALVAASAVAFGLARTITSPIRALQQSAARLGRGELDKPLPELSTDELGDLAHEFNAMARALTAKEATLRASEAKFSVAFRASPAGVVISDVVHGRILEVNDSYLRMLGYDRAEMLGHSSVELEIFSAADRARVAEAVRAQGSARGLELDLRAKSGAWVSVLCSAELIELEGERAFLTQVFDISERKRAEEALRESERKFTVIFDKVPVAALLSSLPGGVIVNVNEAFERVFGYSKQEVAGKTSLELGINPDAQGRARITTELQARGAVRNMQLRLHTKSGVTGDFLVNIDMASIGGQQYVLQTVHDISERTRSEAAILRKNAELSALSQLGQALSRLVEPLELLELLQTLVGRVLDNRNLYIALYDEAAQTVSFPVFTIDGQSVPQASRHLGSGLTEHVIRTQQPLFLPRDVTAAARALGVEPQGRPTSCFLAVPMQVGDKVIGVISIQDYEHADVYDAGHLEILSIIAAQAAIALENARLFAESRRRAEQLQAINDIERVVSTTLDPTLLLVQTVRVIRERLGLPWVAIGLIEGDMLVFERGQRLKVGLEGIAGWVAGSGQMQLVPDVDLDPRFKRGPDAQHTRSELAVPLKTQNGVIGVLNVESDELNAFSPELVALLETLTAQVATAITNARLFEETQRLARSDGLTGIANRRYLLEVGEQELSRAIRFGHPLCALMLDIDHFKQVNDTFGHGIGDQVLRAVARICKECTRDIDSVARYGGEEFTILLVETDLPGARSLAERLRARVAQARLVTDEGLVQVTISTGISRAQLESDSLETLLARADEALYAAKEGGRNRVVD